MTEIEILKHHHGHDMVELKALHRLLLTTKILPMLTDAVERGELATEADIAGLVQMLSALLWGIGFYTAFVGAPEQAATVTSDLRLLLANRLWQIK